MPFVYDDAKPGGRAVYDEPEKKKAPADDPITRGRKEALGGFFEPPMAMVSGMAGKVLGDIGGLGAVGKEMISPTPGGGDPAGFARDIQERMTYQPRTAAGASPYNPLNAIPMGLGKLFEMISKGAGSGTEWAGEKLGVSPAVMGPVRSGVEEAFLQAPQLAGVKGGAALKEGLPARQAALNVEKSANAPLDAIRARSQAAGLTTPVEGTSWLAGIPGIQKLDQWISGKNQPEFNRLIAEQFKLPEGTALSKPALKNIREKAGEEYEKVVQSGYGEEVTEKQPPKVSVSPIVDERGQPITTSKPQPDVKRIPGLPLDDAFRAPLKSDLEQIEAKLKGSPETFKSLRDSARLLREYIKKTEMEPREAMEAIKHLRADAQTGFRSTETNARQAAFTRLEIANRLEDAFEANLKGDPASLDAFRQARKTLAMTYDVEKVIDAAGNVNAQKLASLSQRRPLTENLKLVSDYASTFPRGAKKTAEGKAAFSPFDWMFAVGAGPLKGAVELAGRIGIPYAAERGMLQSGMPRYEASRFGQRALPVFGMATSQQANAPTPVGPPPPLQ